MYNRVDGRADDTPERSPRTVDGRSDPKPTNGWETRCAICCRAHIANPQLGGVIALRCIDVGFAAQAIKGNIEDEANLGQPPAPGASWPDEAITEPACRRAGPVSRRRAAET